MITLNYVLTLSGILFAIAVAGVFLNRRNIIVLLMCIELMLLAVNFNFIAFSRYLGDIGGQLIGGEMLLQLCFVDRSFLLVIRRVIPVAHGVRK